MHVQKKQLGGQDSFCIHVAFMHTQPLPVSQRFSSFMEVFPNMSMKEHLTN